ncbi:MAG TPA: hypothetical protein VMZ91_03370 [Candidatus Paceibacterota bacterium]|nr:hypothetical protein [Candidatus Paceibacterota bacterium]
MTTEYNLIKDNEKIGGKEQFQKRNNKIKEDSIKVVKGLEKQREKDFDYIELMLKNKLLEYEGLEQLQEGYWIIQTLDWVKEEIKKLKDKK